MTFSADGINQIKPFQYEQGNKPSGAQNNDWDEPIIQSNGETNSDISAIESEFAELYEELAMANNEEDRFAIHSEIAALGREYEAEQANQELETIIINSGLPPELQDEVLALVGELDGASLNDKERVMAEIQMLVAQSDVENKHELLQSIEKYSIEIAYNSELSELYDILAQASSDDRNAISAQIEALENKYKEEQANQELETIITNSGLPPELQDEVLALVGELDGASVADRDSIMAEIQLRIVQSDIENKDELLLNIEKYAIGVAYANDISELYDILAHADASNRNAIAAEISALEHRYEQEMQEISFKEQNLEEIRGFQAIVENSGLPEELQGDVMGLIDELKDASPDERDAIIAEICALAARSGYEGFEGSEEFISNIQTYNMELNYKHELQGLYDALAQADGDDRDRIQAEIQALEFRHQMETESNMFE